MDENDLLEYMETIIALLNEMNKEIEVISDKVDWIEFHSNSIDANTSNL